jgi:acyl-CoA oxidase
MAHSDFVYFSSLQDVLAQLSSQDPQPTFLPTLRSLANVFALSVLYNPHHPSLSFALASSLPSTISSTAILALRSAYDIAIADFADNDHAAALVDAWGLTEYELDSALARADKTPYEALWEGAKGSEMSGEKMREVWGVMVNARGVWKEAEEERRGEGERAKL